MGCVFSRWGLDSFTKFMLFEFLENRTLEHIMELTAWVGKARRILAARLYEEWRSFEIRAQFYFIKSSRHEGIA